MTQLLRTFDRDFDAIVAMHGDRIAFIPMQEGRETVSYEQLDRLIQRNIGWLRQLGLQPGERVGALLPNSVEMLALFLACLRGGFGFAPLACDTSRVEAANWVSLVRPALVVLGHILPDAVRAGVTGASVPVAEVVTDGGFAHLPLEGDARVGTGAKIYLYTSGTTGEPKAIVIDGDRLWSAGHAFLRANGIGVDSPFRMWNYLPQSYLGGLFNMCLIPMAAAGSVVVDESFSGKTFLSFWQTIDRYELNALWLVPTIVRGLLEVGERTKRYESKSYRDIIKIAFLGTAPIELATKRRFEEVFGIPLIENYALSETTFLTTETPGSARREGSVGQLLPYVELAFRQVGQEADVAYAEIMVKSPFVCDGYLGPDGVTPPASVDGYFPTGDLGYIDDTGALVVTGRCKEIIKKGGQFVSLAEIEAVVRRHPAVDNAAAKVVAHPFYGETYRLYVQPVAGAAPGILDEIQRFVYENVAKYKWPERIELVTEFPRTSSGKIRKFLIDVQD